MCASLLGLQARRTLITEVYLEEAGRSWRSIQAQTSAKMLRRLKIMISRKRLIKLFCCPSSCCPSFRVLARTRGILPGTKNCVICEQWRPGYYVHVQLDEIKVGTPRNQTAYANTGNLFHEGSRTALFSYRVNSREKFMNVPQPRGYSPSMNQSIQICVSRFIFVV